MNIPWKLKSTIFSMLRYMPKKVLYFLQRHVTGNSKFRYTEPYIGWTYHRKIIEATGAKSVLEFGAGKNLGQNIYLSPTVKEQIVVDIFPMVDFDQVNITIRELVAMGAPIDGRPVTNEKELEEIYNIRYMSPFDMRKIPFANDTFDICISTNTLEHIPRDDIRQILKELFRIIRPDGTVSAMIDYSDHYAHSDKAITRLNYLQFSEQVWDRYNHDNHYQNRLRHGHHRDLFTQAGFRVVDETPTDFCEPVGLNLLKELVTGNDDDHATTGFWHLTRPVLR